MPAADSQVVSFPVLGGLHRDYQRRGVRVDHEVPYPYPFWRDSTICILVVLNHTIHIRVHVLGVIPL